MSLLSKPPFCPLSRFVTASAGVFVGVWTTLTTNVLAHSDTGLSYAARMYVALESLGLFPFVDFLPVCSLPLSRLAPRRHRRVVSCARSPRPDAHPPNPSRRHDNSGIGVAIAVVIAIAILVISFWLRKRRARAFRKAFPQQANHQGAGGPPHMFQQQGHHQGGGGGFFGRHHGGQQGQQQGQNGSYYGQQPGGGNYNPSYGPPNDAPPSTCSCASSQLVVHGADRDS